MRCVDRYGQTRWAKNGLFEGLCAVRGHLLACKENNRRYTDYLFNIDTGDSVSEGVGVYTAAVLSDEQSVVGKTYRKNARQSIGLYALPSFAEIWRRDAEEFSPSYNFEGGVAAADGYVFIGTGPTLDEGEGALIALSETNGKHLWVMDLKECGGPVQGGKWNPMVSQGLVVINTIGGTVAFDAETGRMKWKVPRAGGRAIYQGRVYVTASGWYVVADLATGQVLLETEISVAMKKICPLVFSRLATQINVSETHVFAGDAEGGLWAWERETGEVVWHDHPEGADAFIGVLPVIAGRRLYVSSVGLSGPSYLYCYEEDRGEAPTQEAEDATPKKTVKKATGSKPKTRKKACPGYR